MTTLILLCVFGFLLLLLGILGRLETIHVELSRLRQLATLSSPDREDLADGWALLETGDEVLVEIDDEPRLLVLDEIYDNGCVRLVPRSPFSE